MKRWALAACGRLPFPLVDLTAAGIRLISLLPQRLYYAHLALASGAVERGAGDGTGRGAFKGGAAFERDI
eukprot:scaffold86627_cov21-Tisochrysis_lutea.AAC.1